MHLYIISCYNIYWNIIYLFRFCIGTCLIFLYIYLEVLLRKCFYLYISCLLTIFIICETLTTDIIILYNRINFLDVNERIRNIQVEADLHIKPTDTHQFLDATSRHSYHCKKSITYSQALRYKRICSDNKSLINAATT